MATSYLDHCKKGYQGTPSDMPNTQGPERLAFAIGRWLRIDEVPSATLTYCMGVEDHSATLTYCMGVEDPILGWLFHVGGPLGRLRVVQASPHPFTGQVLLSVLDSLEIRPAARGEVA